MAVGLVASCLLFVVLATAHALILRPYRNADEKRHVQYVVVLEKHGRLPTMKETRGATHPPLFYVLLGKTVMADVTSTKQAAARVGPARAVSIAFGLVALVYAFFLLRLLLPRYPAVAVHATALMAVLPSYANNCAMVTNDAMSLATQFGMIYAAMTILLRGASWGRLSHVALWMAVGALVRVSAVALMPAALLAVFAGVLWHAEGSRLRRFLIGAGVSLGLVALVAASSGWFYLLNDERMGNASGTEAILEQVRYHPVRPLFDVLTSADKWLEIHDELWGRLAGGVRIEGALSIIARGLTLLSIAGAALAVWRAAWWRRLSWPPSPQVISWLVIAACYASVFLPTFYYHAKGGGLHQRYVFGVLYVITLVLALGITWTRHKLIAAAGLAIGLSLALAEHFTYTAIIAGKVKDYPLAVALARHEVPDADTVAALFTVVIAIGLAGVMYVVPRLHRPISEASAPRSRRSV